MTRPSNPSRKLPSVERLLMAVSMGALCTLTMVNVLVRYFTDLSFASHRGSFRRADGDHDPGRCLPRLGSNHHISITYFVERNPAWRHVARRLACGCSLLMFGLLAWYGVRMTWDDYKFEVTTPSLGFPQWWYSIWLPLISLLIVARLVGVLRRGEK